MFCLCIGDGYIRETEKPQFYWYQKEDGVNRLKELIQEIGFEAYDPAFDSARHGITIPQLIRKVAETVLGIETKKDAISDIFRQSKLLGQPYEIALLTAFFVDEAGMSTAKTDSEITLHQEGNLDFLARMGNLLDRFDVAWSKNKKQEKWIIRIPTEGVKRLAELLDEADEYGCSILHRRQAFEDKHSMAQKTAEQAQLRQDTSRVRQQITSDYAGRTVSRAEVLPLFRHATNRDRRLSELLRNMERKGEIKKIAEERYHVVS